MTRIEQIINYANSFSGKCVENKELKEAIRMANMKKIILLTLAASMMMGCAYKKPDGSYSTSRSLDFKTIVIDSCEYIEGYYKLAHKGNCKYCKERRQKELENLLNNLKKL